MPNPSATAVPDGSLDFSGGVNSIVVTTVQSNLNPHGISRNELPWLINGSVRDGGITLRNGWNDLGPVADGKSLYQGGFLYDPLSANPYLIASIGGTILKIDPDNPSPVDLSAAFSLSNPSANDYSYFCQGDRYLVIQAGDGTTLPLFWDGATLRRSKGITNTAVAPGTPGVNEIPAGFSMDYSMGRLWWDNGLQFSAGDIFGGASGVIAPARADAILNVTENPLVLGGDGFAVPTFSGKIRALFHNAQLNTPLGQGTLLAGTRKAIYSQFVPITRNDWIGATTNNQPQQVPVQINFGPVNDRSLVKVNGDVWYQTLEPGIRSLFASVRNFGQWGNTQLSSYIERVLAFNDRSLLRFASGMLFDNRMWQTQLPYRTACGVAHKAIAVMDFVPISTFKQQVGPAWEGVWEGIKVLQMWSGDFGGRERAFALAVSDKDGSIHLWEFTDFQRFEDEDKGEELSRRNTMVIEFPAFTWGDEFRLKKLVTAELWIDKLLGTTTFHMEYRPDSEPCWLEWFKWKECQAASSAEDCFNPVSYPALPYREGYRQTVVLPAPKGVCPMSVGRPSDIGYQFQARLTIHGWARVRGFLPWAEWVDKQLYEGIVC